MSVVSTQRSFQRARGMPGNATRLWQADGMTSSERRTAHGTGLATVHQPTGDVLDVWFPEPALGPPPEDSDFAGLQDLVAEDPDRATSRQVVEVEVDLDAEPHDTPDVWLRLHLLSHRLVRPHGVDLTGIFGKLVNVVWTNHGPCAVEGFEATRLRLMRRGPVQVLGVDKFPRMVDYVLPPGVRIADADRVRLGAHLASGTTVMHEGFVNYNAGTLGASMVEGRLSAGVVVGDGSDIGGGSSIMGTLSGGGTAVISVGERCLIGANAGIGISLGDDCVVEAGCYVTAGTKVLLQDGSAVKARDLSGRDNLLFWRNSLSGAVEVLARSGSWGSLNAALHANN
jgi:2,3,4,5-tetrahydropyridine-2-carboxylate N-succinyltransferase